MSYGGGGTRGEGAGLGEINLCLRWQGGNSVTPLVVVVPSSNTVSNIFRPVYFLDREGRDLHPHYKRRARRLNHLRYPYTV